MCTPHPLNEQESFWAGDFGNEYIQRNPVENYLPSNLAFFADVLKKTLGIKNLIEFGANVGANLTALNHLKPDLSLTALEINPKACEQLNKLNNTEVRNLSILNFKPEKTWDMVLIKGVLIHIAPEDLPSVYEALYQACGRYICLGEYYNPSPVAIPYRGHQNKLFKRDFAGDLLDRYPDLQLRDYGFYYHRDPVFPIGDMTWFLLEKTPGAR